MKTLARLVLVAVAGWTQAVSGGLHGTARAARPGSLAVHDGARLVPVIRIDDETLTWDGFRAGFDRHALLWLDDPEDTALLDHLDVEAVSWPSKTLGLVRVRGRPNEDGLDVATRLRDRVGRGLRGALPDLRIPHRAADIGIPPDDPRYPAQWFFERIGLEAAWALETGSEEVTIVVVDNGCDAEHPDLAAKLDPGRDVVDDDDDPSFEPGARGNEHGTACAGLIGAATDNGVGIAGACPTCRVRCVRLLTDDPGGTPLSADVAAFQFALDVGADVVSNSWGFVDPIPVPGPLKAILEELIQTGRDGAGAVVVFAAGNDNRTLGDDELPAVPGILTVGATNNFDEATPFSNRGRAVDVVAPTGTLTTDVSGEDGQSEGDYTEFFGGTSSACPVVAGIVGLLLSADPSVSANDVRGLLARTAQQSFFATPGADGHDALYGYGIVRPERALRQLLGLAPPPIDAGVDDAGDGGRDLGPDDARFADAGPRRDGSGAPLEAESEGCSSTSSSTPWPVVLLLVLLGGVRARRIVRGDGPRPESRACRGILSMFENDYDSQNHSKRPPLVRAPKGPVGPGRARRRPGVRGLYLRGDERQEGGGSEERREDGGQTEVEARVRGGSARREGSGGRGLRREGLGLRGERSEGRRIRGG